MSCGVGRRQGSDVVVLWLWCSLAAAAPIQPLACLGTSMCHEYSPRKDKKKKKKKKDEHSNRDISEQGMGQRPGASITSLGPTILSTPPHVHQPRSSPNPILLGFLVEASSHRHDPSFNTISSSPLSGEWVWGYKFQASNHGLVFLVTSPHPGAHPESPH